MDDMQRVILNDKLWSVRAAMFVSATLTVLSAIALLQGGKVDLLGMFWIVTVLYAALFILMYKIFVKKRMRLHAQLYQEMIDKIKKERNGRA